MRTVKQALAAVLWLVLAVLAACSPLLLQVPHSPAPEGQTSLSPPGATLEWAPDATATARMATLMVSPPAPVLTETPTSEPGQWHTYKDDRLGISFDYWCWIEEEEGRLKFTDETYLTILPAKGLSLEQVVDQALQQFGPEDYPRRDDTLLNRDPKGITISTIQSHHWLLQTFFQRGDTIFLFSAWMRILTECRAQEMGVGNPAAYYRTVESFRFTR